MDHSLSLFLITSQSYNCTAPALDPCALEMTQEKRLHSPELTSWARSTHHLIDTSHGSIQTSSHKASHSYCPTQFSTQFLFYNANSNLPTLPSIDLQDSCKSSLSVASCSFCPSPFLSKTKSGLNKINLEPSSNHDHLRSLESSL